jgi:hypothetical protein
VTAKQLVSAIEAKGGSLTLRGDKIRCDVPEDVAALLEDVRAQREAVIQILQQRTGGLPWPGYNGGQQFCCERCATRFDTSVGFAKHQVNGCGGPQ